MQAHPPAGEHAEQDTAEHSSDAPQQLGKLFAQQGLQGALINEPAPPQQQPRQLGDLRIEEIYFHLTRDESWSVYRAAPQGSLLNTTV